MAAVCLLPTRYSSCNSAGDAAHADVWAVAERDDQAVRCGGGGKLARGRPGVDPSDPRLGVEVDGVHR